MYPPSSPPPSSPLSFLETVKRGCHTVSNHYSIFVRLYVALLLLRSLEALSCGYLNIWTFVPGPLSCLVHAIVWSLIGVVYYETIRAQYQDDRDELLTILPKPEIPIFYRPEYNMKLFGVERFLHVFDTKKFEKIASLLKKGSGYKGAFTQAPMITRWALKNFYSVDWLRTQLADPFYIAKALRVDLLKHVPVCLLDYHILRPMRYACGGTVSACFLALHPDLYKPGSSIRKGWAINLGGGFHHASHDRAEGFCIYSDISLALLELTRTMPTLKSVLLVDLDAHRGHGVQHDKHQQRFQWNKQSLQVFMLDVYNTDSFPPESLETKDIDYVGKVTSHSTDQDYMSLVSTLLQTATTQSHKPGLILYISGTDILKGDPLGGLKMCEQTIIDRDELVFQTAFAHQIPICMLLGGGFTPNSAEIHAASILNLKTKFRLWT